MNGAFDLSDDDGDSIAELFNIGMGPPAAALSELVGEAVDLSVPSLRVVKRAGVAQELDVTEKTTVIAVREAFYGPFSGEAMLVFSQDAGLALTQKLLSGELPAEERDEAIRDTLSEIGNIILNGCIAGFSNMIGREVLGGVPECVIAPLDEALHGRDETVMFVHIQARLSSGASSLQVLFFLDVTAIEAFRLAVRNVLDGLAT